MLHRKGMSMYREKNPKFVDTVGKLRSFLLQQVMCVVPTETCMWGSSSDTYSQ